MDPLVFAALFGALLGFVAGAALVFFVFQRAAQGQRLDADVLRSEWRREQAELSQRDTQRDAALRDTVQPVAQTLALLERQLSASHEARLRAEGELREHLAHLGRQSATLGQQTHALTSALRSPTQRGRWGELQLRRVVEAAGMLPHCDFSEQSSQANDAVSASPSATQRPDLLIHLTHGRSLVVDAKVPMDAYLDALEGDTPELQARHARALREHVKRLSDKKYWAALPDNPEFVVLFVPSEGMVAAAAQADPGVFEYGFSRNVVIATPATLVALLKTAAHAWRTDALNQNAQQIVATGKTLHQRLNTYLGHVAKLGRSLDASVGAYNDALGSLRSRVLVSVRALESYGVSGEELSEPADLERRPAPLPAQETPQQPGQEPGA
ncbi:DNA recombination protein RmuC [Dermabacteraceae bacterium TAE3-ERU5]|nr:DNA recombination protein RmuC [Dermabacteraceae bacterium TAE3-ERU5]